MEKPLLDLGTWRLLATLPSRVCGLAGVEAQLAGPKSPRGGEVGLQVLWFFPDRRCGWSCRGNLQSLWGREWDPKKQGGSGQTSGGET